MTVLDLPKPGASADQVDWPLETADDSVLYDIFDETGTVLAGCLTDLKRNARASGDTESAKIWQQEHRQLLKDRLAVHVDDRASQIEFIQKWNKRRAELTALHYSIQPA